ncbi:MAG TPA: hypothetical protein VHI77_02945 [Solirubrobacterales bacterium]|jgi:hypothetical protein|nr:hypothetical protein [Solirubrobacterales bacterium]
METRTGARGSARIALAVAVCWLALLGLASGAAAAPPAPTRLVYAPGEIVPIPTAIPHEAGDMVDRRIVPDLRWIAARYPIYITDGYSGPLPNGEHVGCNMCHARGSDHYNGLAVDVVPLDGGTTCDATWAPVTELALWAEPTQNHPVAPFRWVGYNGDAGHGCGNHLHLSWNHAPASRFQLAEWVEAFPVGPGEAGERSRSKKKKGPAAPKPAPPPPPGPAGGISREPTGGVGYRERTEGPTGGIAARGD